MRHRLFRAVVHTRRKSNFLRQCLLKQQPPLQLKLKGNFTLAAPNFFPCDDNIKAVATYLLQTFSENIDRTTRVRRMLKVPFSEWA
jgi:hypothetical protein